MEKKNLAQVTVMLTTFLLAIPVTPATMATSPVSVSVSPSSIVADTGSFFDVTVMVSAVSNLAGYDIALSYKPGILQATGASLGHTAFDMNGNGDISDDPALPLREEIFNSVGLIRYAVVLVGGASVSTSGASLLALTFQVNNPLTGTASDLSHGIGIVRASLVGFDADGNVVSIPTSLSGAAHSLPADAAVRNVGCRAAIAGFNVHAHGFTDGVFCRVTNDGNVPIDVRADFTWVGLLTGDTGAVSSSVMTLQPGQNGQLDASITVSGANDIIVVTGTPVRIVTFPDSTTAEIPGTSDSFSINVN